MVKKKSMGWSQLTKCRALKVRHLVPETDQLIQIKNKEKIMKNLVPDSIKYSGTSSFTYPSYPTKVNGITHLKSYLYVHRQCQRSDWKWLQGEKVRQRISGDQASPSIEEKLSPLLRKEVDLSIVLLPGFTVFR